ncbi:MAG: hypothetical protein ETSY1_20410 [Candidatus Entotheonella factor]|uniref:histidine kinase n=1 Tax=Entotheonella factor TaxID=1429438 RepID=W4LL00_ENTF1|nr:MAG: hypothetical protein ETSY1_20410 [Candidatus Entotheonella factor]
MLTSALSLTEYSLRTAGAEVILDLAPHLPHVLADAVQLQQVFVNLLINAQQALLESPEPRRLHLASYEDHAANRLRVMVSDNGPGVPAAHRSRIFDPFFTTKPTGVGTGMGLSLSHGIVSAHRGTIVVQDSPEGGACFVVTLPLEAPEPPVAASQPEASSRIAPQTILIVDDEREVAEMLSDLLQRVGHQTAIASSGNTALNDLARRDYDLVVCDIHMPDLNGLDFYRRVQASHPQVIDRLLFVTGDTLGTTVRRFLAQTGCRYLEKPLEPKEVIRVVHTMLSEKRGI